MLFVFSKTSEAREVNFANSTYEPRLQLYNVLRGNNLRCNVVGRPGSTVMNSYLPPTLLLEDSQIQRYIYESFNKQHKALTKLLIQTGKLFRFHYRWYPINFWRRCITKISCTIVLKLPLQFKFILINSHFYKILYR